ncbi:MAG: metallophosphoesterase family protein, partial [Coriobacteriia bacterium]|nr:metallophosphoesterase family protein [Coriobacteriia bacterium]
MAGAILMVVGAFAAAGFGQLAYAEDTAAVGAKVVESGVTTWQYSDANVQPGKAWTTDATTTDIEWKSAAGSFGAKKGKIADLGGGCTPQNLLTQYIAEGDDAGKDIPVYYFRTTFDVADVSAVAKIAGEVVYDDAAIVAVNGHVIGEFDNYVYGGTDSIYGTTNYGGSNASAPKTGTINFSDISSLGLKATGNVLTVEVHNGRADSSDVYFDMTSLSLLASSGSDDTAPAADEVIDAFLGIGSSESQRSLNWLGTSSNTSYVQYVAAPAGYKEGDAFPEGSDGVKSVVATQATAQREGYNSNKATIYGLSANTTYVYRVGNDDAWSDAYAFTTGSFGNGSSFSFLVAGDPQIGASGNTGSDAEGWNSMMTAAQDAFEGTSFLFSMGDQINNYDGAKTDTEYDAYLAPDALRTMTTANEVGNHDEGAHVEANTRYSDYFNNPNVSSLGQTTGAGSQGGDYWFTYNGVLFMSLNSNNTSTAEHKQFMEQAIAANPDAVWTVASFHHSTYSVANHYTDKDIVQRRQELSPIFSELGVDVVLMGHDHHYTRTYLMEGTNSVIPDGYDVSKGEKAPSEQTAEEGQVFYLTADSASGSKYYRLNSSLAQGLPTFSAVDWQGNMPSITNVEVSNGSIVFTSYYQDTDGSLKQFDQFTLKKAGSDDKGDEDKGDTDKGDTV